MNWYYLFISALIPMITGFIWYSPKLFGNAWMKVSGVTLEDGKKINMAVVLSLSYLLSLFLSAGLMSIVIHQAHIFSIFANDPHAQDPGSEMMVFMEKHGQIFRTFKHGAFHGFLASVMLALPFIGVISLFERKGGKYVLIHWGYWAVTLMLMGGLLCAMM